MKNVQLNSKFFSRTKVLCSPRNPEISYNEIIINHDKSFQPTETAVVEFSQLGFRNQSVANRALSYDNVSAVET